MTINMKASRGISIIEVLIAFAVTCIFLATTLPAHRDSLIRDRVSEGIRMAAPAREALVKTCAADPQSVVKRNIDAGYLYIPSPEAGDYISRIELSADCTRRSMIVLIWTGNTGATHDPVIALTADSSGHGESWICQLVEGDLRHVPPTCQLPETTMLADI
jgi:type IV pilus assembly protein PilA